MAANCKQRLVSSDRYSVSGQALAYSLDSKQPKRTFSKIDSDKLIKSLIETID